MSVNTFPILYDSAGYIITSPQASLYSDPNLNINEFRPRFYSLQDTEKSVNQYEREKLVRYSQDIIGKSAVLDQSIKQKAQWAFGTNYEPVYVGVDEEWGIEATAWLSRWLQHCNTKGWDANTVLQNISYELDRSGDLLQVLTETKNGYPLVRYICSHRIGSRNYSDVVKTGLYKGLKIQDGVIISDNTGLPVAYNILGDTEAEDYQVSVQSAQLISEPKHMDKFRGIPPLACALKDGLDVEDIDHYLKLMVKLESSVGILHTNETGVAPVGTYNPLKDTKGKIIPPTGQNVPNDTPYKPINGGSIMYFQVGKGKLDSFNTNRPADTTISYIKRIEHRLVGSVWVYEILNPNESGGAAARGIAEQGRKLVETRQKTVERAFRIGLLYAVARAQRLGLIKDNRNGDTTSWTFTHPAELTLDQGYEHQANVELYKLGLMSGDELVSRTGKRLKDVKAQVKKENKEVIAEAKEYQKENGGTLEYWINFVSQRYSNAPTGVTPPTTVENSKK